MKAGALGLLATAVMVLFCLSAAADATNADARRGLAVLALGASTDATWPLAQTVYASATLRPASIDDERARVLAGEPAAADTAAKVRDIAALRAAIRGDDAASRVLLSSLASTLLVRGIVVVDAATSTVRARVFVAETGAFDAALYQPGGDATNPWGETVRSLERAFGPSSAPVAAPAVATHDVAAPKSTASPGKRSIWASPWLWSAVGAAALAGGALYLATRDPGSDRIRLQVEVPR